MSFSPHTLVVGPTQRIEIFPGTRVRIIPVAPGESYFSIVDGVRVSLTTEPSASGELIVSQASGSGANAVVVLYVAVEIDEVLYWKKASLIPALDRYTRQPRRFV